MDPLHEPLKSASSVSAENSPKKDEIGKVAREKLEISHQENASFSWLNHAIVWIKESWIGKWFLSCFYSNEKKAKINDEPDSPFRSKAPIPPDKILEAPPKEEHPPSPPSNPSSPIKNPEPTPQPYRRVVSVGEGIDKSEVLAPIDLSKALWLYEIIAVKTSKGFIAGWLQRNYKPGESLYDNKLLINFGKIVKFIDINDLFYTTASFKFKVGDPIKTEETDPLTLASFLAPGFLAEYKNKVVRIIDRKPHDTFTVFDGTSEFETHVFNLHLINY